MMRLICFFLTLSLFGLPAFSAGSDVNSDPNDTKYSDSETAATADCYECGSKQSNSTSAPPINRSARNVNSYVAALVNGGNGASPESGAQSEKGAGK
ncbi:MAG: hypothetical protein H6626_12170 [Pseudobdellovibrionaceae bacterium]|nr:hypothetical protein [Bdellovibrionales bacterium]USN46943.1 MAG: hypothetical protein H6626_12170 [Pseudobdellovibrionaceae bacterium]